MELVVHITPIAGWLSARPVDAYRAASLDDEGFIHCSTFAQVCWVAEQRYAGVEDLVLLVIDPARLTADLRYEDCYETGQDFPHVYGPVDLTAVLAVVEFPAGPDGTFALPPLLATLAKG